MATQSKPFAKYNTPLRQAQRDLTRSRIKNAARDLFHEQHYDTTTMDDIASAAGLRRSTLYLHFKDKAEILADIIADYAPKARSVLSALPGPEPTLSQLQCWIMDVTQFISEERIPLSIILEARRNVTYTASLEYLTNELLAGLGENNPPFREAARATAEPALFARGLLLLQQLTYACRLYLLDTDNVRGQALLQVTAQDFHAFLSDRH